MAVGSLVTAAIVTAVALHPVQQAQQPLDRIFVATWGHDDWPGTFDRPFATPERAQREVREQTKAMRSDIVVSLRGGTYRMARPLKMSTADSGRNGHRVVYEAYGREPVSLSGGQPIGNWRNEGNVWRADVRGLETRQLYVNDVRARRARTDEPLGDKPKMTATGYTVPGKGPRSVAAAAEASTSSRGLAPGTLRIFALTARLSSTVHGPGRVLSCACRCRLARAARHWFSRSMPPLPRVSSVIFCVPLVASPFSARVA